MGGLSHAIVIVTIANYVNPGGNDPAVAATRGNDFRRWFDDYRQDTLIATVGQNVGNQGKMALAGPGTPFRWSILMQRVTRSIPEGKTGC